MYSDFLRNTIGDGARGNKFNVVFNFRTSNNFEKKLAITCKSCDYPTIATKTVDFKYKGKNIPIPITSNYDNDWSAEFILDEKHLFKEFFDEWIMVYHSRGKYASLNNTDYKNSIKLSDGTFFSSFNDSYFTVDVDIYQFPFDTVIMPDTVSDYNAHYRLFNVFPLSVQKLSATETDELLSIKVDFKYSYFERE